MEADDKVNILVIDDLAENLLAMRLILESLGQNVVTARSGREALRCLLERDFAVILIDVNMPGMDGFETAALIRQRKRSGHTPIIFITAFSDEMHAAQGYSLGAVDYILSPVIPDVLRTKVGVFVDLFKITAQATRQAEERIALAKEQAARAAAEEVTRRSLFLVEAGMQLAKALDFEATLRAFLHLTVPFLTDMATVTIVDDHNGTWKTEQIVASTEASPRVAPTFSSLSGRESVPEVLASAIDRALGSGTPVFLAFSSPETSEANGSSFAFRSIFAMSLRARGRTLGAVTLALGPSGRDFDPKDQALAEELVGRAAVVIDNARLYRDIQESDRHKNEFLAMLAHELRNPLAPIRNAVQVLKMPNTDSVQQQWASDVIARQVEQMVRLVDDLLDVSRITRGKIQLQTDLVDVAAVAARAVETSRPLVEARKHELTIQLPTEPLYVKADSTRLAQVMANLLNNAAKYTEEGGRIGLSVAREGNEIVFRVRDNGIGIAPEMLARVFDMFTQADRAIDRSQGGLGIGLTLVRRLIELHGGSVQAFSAGPNTGSEFVVRLPAPSGQAPKAKSHPSKDAASNSSARFRILIVDDNVDGAESLAVVLRTFGQEVQTVYDGPGALTLAETFRPQIILLDIGLPGLNGYEVAKRLRANRDLEKPLLVAVTGYGQKEDRLTARRAGFDHHLVKPVVGDTLPDLLTSLYKTKVRPNDRH